MRLSAGGLFIGPKQGVGFLLKSAARPSQAGNEVSLVPEGGSLTWRFTAGDSRIDFVTAEIADPAGLTGQELPYELAGGFGDWVAQPDGSLHNAEGWTITAPRLLDRNGTTQAATWSVLDNPKRLRLFVPAAPPADAFPVRFDPSVTPTLQNAGTCVILSGCPDRTGSGCGTAHYVWDPGQAVHATNKNDVGADTTDDRLTTAGEISNTLHCRGYGFSLPDTNVVGRFTGYEMQAFLFTDDGVQMAQFYGTITGSGILGTLLTIGGDDAWFETTNKGFPRKIRE